MLPIIITDIYVTLIVFTDAAAELAELFQDLHVETDTSEYAPLLSKTRLLPPSPPHYVRQDGIHTKLDEALQTRKVAFIVGEMGMGKTTIATHYAVHNQNQYQHILWISFPIPHSPFPAFLELSGPGTEKSNEKKKKKKTNHPKT
jgi:hypothetical protein